MQAQLESARSDGVASVGAVEAELAAALREHAAVQAELARVKTAAEATAQDLESSSGRCVRKQL